MRNAASQAAKAATTAPLERLIYQEGDMSQVPVVPHALAVRRLLHADSNLLRGRVPANATEKDFIRRRESLRPKDILEQTLRVKPVSTRPRPASAFGETTALAEDALRRELDAVGKQLARQQQRAGAAAASCRGAASSGIGSPAQDPLAPPAHPSVVLESEGVRAGMTAASSIAQLLAQRPGAPTTSSPAPAHHFMSGGSRAQLRKEQRRAINQEKLREVNLDLRKEQLVTRNLGMLQALGEQQQQARQQAEQVAEQLHAFVAAGAPQHAGAAAAAAARAAPAALSGTSVPPAIFSALPSEKTAAGFQPVVAGVGALAVLLLAVGLTLGAAAMSKRRQARG
jgi:hypothetical protein